MSWEGVMSRWVTSLAVSPLIAEMKQVLRAFLLEDRLDLVQDLRKPVHRDGKEDEVVVLDDLLQVVRRIDPRREAGDLVHSAETPGQVLRQMPRVQVLPVDRLADVDVVVIDDHPLVVPAELVGKGGPQPARPDDGDSARIQRQIERIQQHDHQSCMTSRAMTIR